jgi:exopolyphosphatase / guanosine-5'-triphosphate,3'-diphosphate pyrophosphatase
VENLSNYLVRALSSRSAPAAEALKAAPSPHGQHPHQRAQDMAPIAVVDIGSNSVRLVAYDRQSRAPVSIFNEKSLCGLGRQVAVSGRLPEDGLAQARAALKRFRVLCDFMRVERLYVLATAAVRRAENGRAFIEEVRAILGTDVLILSGAEEAHLAACGVLAGLHHSNGLAADLGGGSLEVIEVAKGRIGIGASFELGGLALRDSSGRNLKKAAKIVTDTLKDVPSILAAKGRDIFAIGGTWRAIARLHMARTEYPLNVLHGYCVDAGAMIAFCQELQRIEIDSLPGIVEIARERRPLLVYGALVLEHLLHFSEAARFVVSTSGVREGLLYNALDEKSRAKDPLLEGARALNALHARAPEHADELIAWCDHFYQTLAPQDPINTPRMRHAACLVSEMAWRANPDYRAMEAARTIAHSALWGLDHGERAFLASVQHARYEGLVETSPPPLRSLLSPEQIDQARVLGCLLRVAYNISAGQPGILPHTHLGRRDRTLVLIIPHSFGDLSNERLLARLKQVGRVLGLESVILDV